ncbi:hypothetical protein ECO26_1787 [Escherichia coli O26:H11 str. 11368]|uniref:Uncharacterized protein n=1 Tax=Escherichia coli O157:H7 TaxID=83334 RepID=Q8X4F4_ECO57|nr:unknown protein encoded by prophage CP-933O [Escherichia coli O157:H7 str. EDL933]BAI25083.1 hypothetical protein ECO26_1787 [Escherichia coli O26:H11 str. 11368]
MEDGLDYTHCIVRNSYPLKAGYSKQDVDYKNVINM